MLPKDIDYGHTDAEVSAPKRQRILNQEREHADRNAPMHVAAPSAADVPGVTSGHRHSAPIPSITKNSFVPNESGGFNFHSADPSKSDQSSQLEPDVLTTFPRLNLPGNDGESRGSTPRQTPSICSSVSGVKGSRDDSAAAEPLQPLPELQQSLQLPQETILRRQRSEGERNGASTLKEAVFFVVS
jgi:hypothetical protein